LSTAAKALIIHSDDDSVLIPPTAIHEQNSTAVGKPASF